MFLKFLISNYVFSRYSVVLVASVSQDNMNLYSWFCLLTTLCSSRIAAVRQNPIVVPDEPTETTTKKIEPFEGIPLELAFRLGNVTDIDDESKPPVIIAARFGTPIERKAFKKPKIARCIPELETVSLVPKDTDPSTVYLPSCTMVARCGGCCYSHRTSCQPVEVEILQLVVVIAEYVSGDKAQYRRHDVVSVEQHKSCKCDCKIKETHCHPYQKYNKARCECECTNRDKQKKCNEESSTKYWNSNECACVCRAVLDCPSGFYYNRFTCECLPERRRTVNAGFDRFKYNYSD